MSITDDHINDMIRSASYKTFTLSEACDFVKTIDRYSICHHTIRWVSARTSNPVSIGYNKINK